MQAEALQRKYKLLWQQQAEAQEDLEVLVALQIQRQEQYDMAIFLMTDLLFYCFRNVIVHNFDLI